MKTGRTPRKNQRASLDRKVEPIESLGAREEVVQKLIKYFSGHLELYQHRFRTNTLVPISIPYDLNGSNDYIRESEIERALSHFSNNGWFFRYASVEFLLKTRSEYKRAH